MENQNFNEIESVFKIYDDAPAPPVSVIPSGYSDVQITIAQRGEQPVNLQLFSRDGNHIAGKALGAGGDCF